MSTRRRRCLAAFVASAAACRARRLATFSGILAGCGAGWPEVVEGSGFLDGRQVSRYVDPEAAEARGDVLEFVPPFRLGADMGGQAQHDSQFGADDRHRSREHTLQPWLRSGVERGADAGAVGLDLFAEAGEV